MKINRSVARRSAFIIVALTLSAGLAAAIAQAVRSQEKSEPTTATAATTAAQPARPALTVTTVRPKVNEWPLKLAANGNIAAWQEAVIGAEVNGLRLTEVKANVGDIVRKGQLLAVFEAETVHADIALVRAGLAEAQAALADAQSNAERARQLKDTGAVSAQMIGQYLTAEATARARIASAQAQLRQQELRLKRTRVLAPDDGVISQRQATVGAVVQAGLELFRMIRQNRLEWRAEVTSVEIERLKSARAVTVWTAQGATIKGNLRVIAPTADPSTRNTIVYVDLPVGSDARAGQFARGEFELGANQALSVPQQSVVIKDGFSYVFQVGADQRVILTRVQTGRRSGDLIEITTGLKSDVPIVATGAGFLNDGDLVSVTSAVQKAAK